MPGVLYLANILQCVINTFHNTTLAKHKFIEDAHQFVFHIPLDFGDKLYPAVEKLFENCLLHQVTFIAVQFAKKLFAKGKQQICIIVGYATLGKLKGNDFPHIIDNQV